MNVEQLMEWELAGKTEVLEKRTPQYHFFPLQIPYDLTCDRTRAAMLGSE
jgi:hypothetical protein